MIDLVSDRLSKPISSLAAASAAKAFDAVVVGGGSAGITAARTLVEAGKRVALLEAGPVALLTHIQSTDLRFDSNLARNVQQALSYSPQGADGSLFGALIGCLGGRGLFWNGAAPRFSAEDLASWPLALGDLDSCYDWAETEFRASTAYASGRLSEAVIEKLRAANIAAELGPYAVDCHATANGWLAGTVGNAVAPLLRSTLLTTDTDALSLSTRAFVRRILTEGGSVCGVEAVDLVTGDVQAINARSVVLAAGAFESVRLAQVSGCPNPHDLLGRYISDHIFVRAYYPIPTGLYDSATPEVGIVWVPARADRNYQIEIHLPADNMFMLNENTHWSPDGSAYYAAMVRSFSPVQPRAENFVTPLPGDRPGSYKVSLSLDADDRARASMQIDALEAVRSALGADPAPVQTMPMGSSHHESGGLMMGSDSQSSVSDPFGRLRGLDGLVVADSSAWPSPSPTNPHLTIVAVARRQAQQLASDL